MKTVIALVAGLMVLALVAAPVATAQTQTGQQITGKIKSVEGDKVTLEDGTTLMVPQSMAINRADLKAGASVKGTYEMKGTDKVVNSLTFDR